LIKEKASKEKIIYKSDIQILETGAIDERKTASVDKDISYD
jgi:hypothetical protein